MNINNVTSDLRFDGSYIQKLNINNDGSSVSDNPQRTLNIKFDPYYYGESDGRHLGKVDLSIKITVPKRNQKSFLIDAIFTGMFSADASIDEAQFKKQVAINGGAALYSIARGKLESISALSFSGIKIVIPLINVLDYYKALAEKGDRESGHNNDKKNE